MTLNDQVNKTVNDVKDAAKEAMHRSAADAERARRDVEGDTMTPGEKLDSLGNEAKERTEAGIDHGKRVVRDNT